MLVKRAGGQFSPAGNRLSRFLSQIYFGRVVLLRFRPNSRSGSRARGSPFLTPAHTIGHGDACYSAVCFSPPESAGSVESSIVRSDLPAGLASDLKNASQADYQNAYADLAQIGLKKTVVGEESSVVAPTTMTMGEFTGQSVTSVRDFVREKVKSAFQAR